MLDRQEEHRRVVAFTPMPDCQYRNQSCSQNHDFDQLTISYNPETTAAIHQIHPSDSFVYRAPNPSPWGHSDRYNATQGAYSFSVGI